jgi:hypothetical protein
MEMPKGSSGILLKQVTLKINAENAEIAKHLK